ncbi:MAG: hypothetical protein GF353_28690 [Candidatus Lokiarchaeota archaeon]|nr:hypothetical protein [Candidatus Lokiarchaeota archaeon]MBD3353980.1 hypothetical protein [Candidatus Lokiarchaeota archaeon]
MKSKNSKSKKQNSFPLRMPPSTKKLLNREARERGISLNAHICNLLFNYLNEDTQQDTNQIDLKLQDINANIIDLKEQRSIVMDQLDMMNRNISKEITTDEENEMKILNLLSLTEIPQSELSIANEFSDMSVLEVWAILTKLSDENKVTMNNKGKWSRNELSK